MIKEKNFSKIILLLPIFFIIISTFSTLYIAISFLNTHTKSDIETSKNQKVRLEAQSLKNTVNNYYNYLSYKKLESNIRLKKRLIRRVYMAHELISKIYEEKKDLVSDKQLRLEILNTLKKIRFGKNGYLFVEHIISDNKSVSKLTPSSPEIENTPSYNIKDATGKYFVREAINIVKTKKEGFLKYKWYKLSKKKQSDKISFIKIFEPFNWYIGYGEYIDDFEIQLKEEAIKRLDLFEYNKNKYIWIHDINHTLIYNPYRKADIGKNDKELIDKKNTKIIQLFMKKALENKDGNFVEYYWAKPNEQEMSKKIGFVKYFKDWNWVIGSGIYMEDLELALERAKKEKEKGVEEVLSKSIYFVLIILLIVIVISYFVSNQINNSFQIYKSKIERNKEELEEKVDEKTKQLKDLNEQLEEKIAKRIKELKEKDKILSQQSKMVALGEMIGNIAHQWRQPLSTISTAASGLKVKKEMNILTDEDIIEFSDGIVKNAKYLSQVIEDFKNYIKNEKEKVHFKIEVAIENALNIFDSSIHNHNLQIIKKYKKDIELHNYKNELIQVLVVILNNAKDALKKKQKDDEDRIIFISTDTIANKAVITIEDTAGGIDENIINKVFEPYFTTKNKEQGTGLGLYMAYQIVVESMKGNIRVENTSNNYNDKNYIGAKFTITLDLKDKSNT